MHNRPTGKRYRQLMSPTAADLEFSSLAVWAWQQVGKQILQGLLVPDIDGKPTWSFL